jgi:hypothetical protein
MALPQSRINSTAAGSEASTARVTSDRVSVHFLASISVKNSLWPSFAKTSARLAIARCRRSALRPLADTIPSSAKCPRRAPFFNPTVDRWCDAVSGASRCVGAEQSPLSPRAQ